MIVNGVKVVIGCWIDPMGSDPGSGGFVKMKWPIRQMIKPKKGRDAGYDEPAKNNPQTAWFFHE